MVKGNSKQSLDPTPGFLARLEQYSPAANWITSLLAILISVVSLRSSIDAQSKNEQREAGRAEIYLQGTPPIGGCVDPKSAETISGCRLIIKPSDPLVHVLRAVIQYPSSEFPNGRRKYDESYGSIELSLIDRTGYLSNRNREIFGSQNAIGPSASILPITITTYYRYNGAKYVNTSAYFLRYFVMNYGGRRVAIPNDLVYCGRLDGQPTFLVDPWIPSTIGFVDGGSTSVLFECMSKATWFEADKGRFRVSSNLAKRGIAEAQGNSFSMPIDVRTYTSTPIGETAYLRTWTRELR